MFVHLYLHTEYSISNSIIRIEDLLNTVTKYQMPAVAMTDHMNLFGAIKFYITALRYGIKPIIGAEISYCIDNKEDTIFQAIVLCKDMTGYRNLSELISRAYQSNLIQNQPIIRRSWLLDKLEGLIVLLGFQSDIGFYIHNQNNVLLKESIKWWVDATKKELCLSLERLGKDDNESFIHASVRLAKQESIPLVAVNNVRFLHAQDFEAYEARVCISNGEQLAQHNRSRIYTKEQYLKSISDMNEIFIDLPQALLNSVQIAKRCNLKLPIGKTILPNFPLPVGITVNKYLQNKAQEGLKKRFLLLNSSEEKNVLIASTYLTRLERELDVILRMGYAGYFLIVADFIQWAKDQNIPVGPGRGSGAGSLVAYALGITDLDPLKYDLLFERFLNPERVSLPDFDIDFCMEGRDRVIQYVVEKYGQENVAQIITFGTMTARAVVRDVGRVMGLPYGYVDKVAKLIPTELGITLDKALADEPELQNIFDGDEEVKNLILLSKQLEGLTRNASRHAGGVVIAPEKITNYTPIYIDKDSQFPVTQFDKNDIEAIGLIKFDFLGLKTLTIIQKALQYINYKLQKEQKPSIDIASIPMDDAPTYELLQLGKTTAVFQLESYGIKQLIMRLKPDCIEDIIALVALYRPGPLQSGMVEDFINRKHGEASVRYLHPKLETILSSTYGVIVYQEQVMQIAQSLGGYSLGSADLLRRAMGKKKPEEMAKLRKTFIAGAIQSGMSEHDAGTVFDLMEKFAGYGFNKSHSAAYALLSYQTAWLKTHYTAAYMAAVLSSDMDYQEKIVILIKDCNDLGIKILHPDINKCNYHFTVIDEQTIAYGLGAIKGVGQSAIESIIESREKVGKFDTFESFCFHLDLKKCNRRALEALISAGAFDCFGHTRASLLGSLEQLVVMVEQFQKNNHFGQNDLFQHVQQLSVGPHLQAIQVKHVPEMTMLEKLRAEKACLGNYMSGHPMEFYKKECETLQFIPISNLIKNNVQNETRFAGVITSIKKILTRSGDDVYFLGIEDASGQIEISLFGEIFRKQKAAIYKEAVVVVRGHLVTDNTRIRMRASEIYSIEQFREECCSFIQLNVDLKKQKVKDIIEHLKAIKGQDTTGYCPLTLKCYTSNVLGKLRLGSAWYIKPTDQVVTNLKKLFGDDNVLFVYDKITN